MDKTSLLRNASHHAISTCPAWSRTSEAILLILMRSLNLTQMLCIKAIVQMWKVSIILLVSFYVFVESSQIYFAISLMLIKCCRLPAADWTWLRHHLKIVLQQLTINNVNGAFRVLKTDFRGRIANRNYNHQFVGSKFISDISRILSHALILCEPLCCNCNQYSSCCAQRLSLARSLSVPWKYYMKPYVVKKRSPNSWSTLGKTDLPEGAQT